MTDIWLGEGDPNTRLRMHWTPMDAYFTWKPTDSHKACDSPKTIFFSLLKRITIVTFKAFRAFVQYVSEKRIYWTTEATFASNLFLWRWISTPSFLHLCHSHIATAGVCMHQCEHTCQRKSGADAETRERKQTVEALNASLKGPYYKNLDQTQHR